MFDVKFLKNGLAGTIFAGIMTFGAISQGGESKPLVVVGIPPDRVALFHPAPEYPRVASELGISGEVVVHVLVKNGKMINVSAQGAGYLLRGPSAAWIRNKWEFRPDVSGEYTIPISYKRYA